MTKLTIWKFPLEITDQQTIEMPRAARILNVQAQGNILTLWALVSPDAEKVRRQISVYGTGDEIDAFVAEFATYVGTAQTHSGALVWHVFDWGER